MRVAINGWVHDTNMTQKGPVVSINVNASIGPAPGGYVAVPGVVEVFLTGDELRELWDGWAAFHGHSERPS